MYNLYTYAIEEIYRKYPPSNIILLGDFNIPIIIWPQKSNDKVVIKSLNTN